MYDIESARFLNPRYGNIPDFCPKNVRHRGQAFKGGRAGKYLEGIVDLYDKEGYRISEFRGQLLATLSLKPDQNAIQNEDQREDVFLKINKDGSYTVSYLVKTAGTWSLSITDEKQQHIDGEKKKRLIPTGSPFDVQITFGEISADRSVLLHVEQIGYVTNYKVKFKAQEFIVQAKDFYGNCAKEGGSEFVATILGGGKVISLTDFNDGRYLILCYVDEKANFSKLKVTLFGRDVINSPFDLTTFRDQIEAHNSELSKYQDLFQNVEKCKLVFHKNLEIVNNFKSLKESFEKMQKETQTSYNAARLRVVHSIPAVFSINEPSQEEQLEKRKKLVEDYKELNQELVNIETNLQKLQESKNELNDYLIEKSKASTKLYKEALEEYNKTTGKILRLTRETKKVQKLRKKVYEGDMEAFKKLEDDANLEESLRILRQSDRGIKSPENNKNEQEEDDLQQEETVEKRNQTIPDKPNSLAFWLMEGRFRPPKKSSHQ